MIKLYTDRYILTPGPTEIPLRIKLALMKETTNPDLDPEFLTIYNETRDMLRKILGVYKGSVYIMTGEAMLGLEAAVANTVRNGTKVLVVANGVFGEGFIDLVRAYGGEPISVETCEECWRRSADPSLIDRVLEKHKDIEVITLVHCDTPSAILNNLEEVGKIAREHGSLLIVDAVSSIGGVSINFNETNIGILIGGSQKVLNTPPGLTIMAISDQAWERIEEVNYRGFYLDIKTWKYMLDDKGIFPYTVSDVLVYALRESLSMIIEEGPENVYRRHEIAKKASWAALEVLNLKPYPLSIEYSSPTVTAFETPSGVNELELRKLMWEKYGVMIAGSWGRLQGRVLRIGHMGVQASRTHVITAFTTLAKAMSDLGFNVNKARLIEA
ncbi:MAG: alanine--glyoxylate aminotransferase family protein, partial [Desulfurococcaceae archaeon]